MRGNCHLIIKANALDTRRSARRFRNALKAEMKLILSSGSRRREGPGAEISGPYFPDRNWVN